MYIVQSLIFGVDPEIWIGGVKQWGLRRRCAPPQCESGAVPKHVLKIDCG